MTVPTATPSKRRGYQHLIKYKATDGSVKNIRIHIKEDMIDERYERAHAQPIIGAGHTYLWIINNGMSGTWDLTCNSDTYYNLRSHFD